MNSQPSNCACFTRGDRDTVVRDFTRQIKALEYAIGKGPYGITVGDVQCDVNSEVTGKTCSFRASLVEGPLSDEKGRPNMGKRLTGNEVRMLMAECGLK